MIEFIVEFKLKLSEYSRSTKSHNLACLLTYILVKFGCWFGISTDTVMSKFHIIAWKSSKDATYHNCYNYIQ